MLEQKRSSQGLKRCPYRIPVSQVVTALSTVTNARLRAHILHWWALVYHDRELCCVTNTFPLMTDKEGHGDWVQWVRKRDENVLSSFVQPLSVLCDGYFALSICWVRDLETLGSLPNYTAQKKMGENWHSPHAPFPSYFPLFPHIMSFVIPCKIQSRICFPIALLLAIHCSPWEHVWRLEGH